MDYLSQNMPLPKQGPSSKGGLVSYILETVWYAAASSVTLIGSEVYEMRKNPLWFNAISMLVIVLAIASLFTSAPFFRIGTMLGLVVIMASLGKFELSKNRTLAFMLFGVAGLQILVLINSLHVLLTN